MPGVRKSGLDTTILRTPNVSRCGLSPLRRYTGRSNFPVDGSTGAP